MGSSVDGGPAHKFALQRTQIIKEQEIKIEKQDRDRFFETIRIRYG